MVEQSIELECTQSLYLLSSVPVFARSPCFTIFQEFTRDVFKKDGSMLIVRDATYLLAIVIMEDTCPSYPYILCISICKPFYQEHLPCYETNAQPDSHASPGSFPAPCFALQALQLAPLRP